MESVRSHSEPSDVNAEQGQVLVEGPSRTDSALLRGRTRRNTTVNFAGTSKPGALVDVRIDDATSTSLKGEALTAVAA